MNYGEKIEGGKININEGNYDEGKDLSIIATPDDDYYFYAWKNFTVTGVDSSGSDTWTKHSSFGSFNNEIQITVNNKFNLIPIFLKKSPLNQSKSWDFQGFVTPGFTGLGAGLLFDELEEVAVRNTNRALNKIIENGGNSIVLDYHIQHKGGVNGNQISIENNEQFMQIVSIGKMAEKLVINLTLKPVLLTESHINKNIEYYDWSKILPSSPNTFFNNYLSVLEQTASLIKEHNLLIDKWVITNELVSLTTNESFSSEWISIITKLKSIVDINLGFNVRATNTEHVASRKCSDNNVQEYALVPDEVYNQLDFIGLSIYRAKAWANNKAQNATLSQELYAEYWHNGPFIELNFDNNSCGECVKKDCEYSFGINYVYELNEFISSKNKDIYISEFGAMPYKNLTPPDWNNTNLNVELDLELQKEYILATLNVFKNSVIGLKGVNGYMFPLQEKLESKNEIDAQLKNNWFNDNYWILGKLIAGNEYEWNINDKPALNAFKQYYIN